MIRMAVLLANIFATLELGITKYDSAIGGLGVAPMPLVQVAMCQQMI